MTQIKATLVDHMGSDLTTVNAARVSFGKESFWANEAKLRLDGYLGVQKPTKPELSEKDQKLIRYLGEHNHISPFGHSFASFHVKAPIFVARQLVKHKFLRWNEISRRYVDGDVEFYTPDEWRGRSEDKKQGSSGTVSFAWDGWDNKQFLSIYQNALDSGVAPEQARMLLPQSTMTEWYWSGSLDAFASMCNLRCKEDTQYESRLVADQIDEIMGMLYPYSWEALRK